MKIWDIKNFIETKTPIWLPVAFLGATVFIFAVSLELERLKEFEKKLK